jgi:hypothetical protein
MKSRRKSDQTAEGAETSELLLLPDGRVFAHNITTAMAAVLYELNCQDEQLSPRSRAAGQLPSDPAQQTIPPCLSPTNSKP